MNTQEKWIAAHARDLLLPGFCSYRSQGYMGDIQTTINGGLMIFLMKQKQNIWAQVNPRRMVSGGISKEDVESGKFKLLFNPLMLRLKQELD